MYGDIVPFSRKWNAQKNSLYLVPRNEMQQRTKTWKLNTHGYPWNQQRVWIDSTEEQSFFGYQNISVFTSKRSCV